MTTSNPLHHLTRTAGKIPIFLLLFLTFSFNCVYAQPIMNAEYSYRRYTTQDGLPCMATTSIFKDSKGFLWQGTLKGGTRFDGFNFTFPSWDKFINVNKIEEIDGHVRFLWGGYMFYPETEKLITLSDTIQLQPHNSYSLPANYYIFGHPQKKEKYFVKLEHDTIAEILYIPQLQGLYRCKVFLDLQQNLLYIPNYREKKVVVYNLQTQKVQNIENVIIETFIKHSRLGLLAIGDEGVYKIENNKALLWVPLKFEKVNKIAVETRNGDIYIKDFFNVYRIRGNEAEHLYRSSTLTFWDMTLDDDENVWLATDKGLYNFFHFDFKNMHIAEHNIRSITQDEDETYWLAGEDEDIFSFSKGVLKQIKYPFNSKIESITFNYVASFNNTTYFLIPEGILIHRNHQFTWADVPLRQYYSNIVQYGNNLAVVGSDGAFIISPDGKLIKKITEEELMQPGLYYGLAVDKKNRLIVGGSDGISIIENEKITLLKNENTTYSDIVCVDHQNHIFSAAKKYLNLVVGDSIQTIYSFENDYIMGLLAVENENMIIATLKGFYIFNTKSYFEKNKIELLFFNHNNGMNGIEPHFRQLFIDKQGVVWLITSESMVTFDPQKLIRQIAAPKLIIQNFAISKDNVQWENIENYDNVQFSYKQKNFKISVIGLNFSAVENVRYHYRLRGFQNDWSEPTKQREITFNNLPPGDYMFEIYADAGTDDSRCEIQSFAFSIKPAFWQRAWFSVACIAFLMLGSAGVTLNIQRRKNRTLMENLRIEKELNELRISSIRLKAIPHFNANVLSAIEYYIANRTKEDAMRILSIYSDFTIKTLSELDKAARPISDELAYVKMYLDLEKIRFMDKFDFKIEVKPEVNQNVQLPNMILHTYCENAVKHGLMPLKSGGHLSIVVSQHNNKVCVSVEDNGVGRTYASQNPDMHSTKQGLTILNRQIEIYNRFNYKKITQHIEDLEVGTRFTVEVPVGFAYVN